MTEITQFIKERLEKEKEWSRREGEIMAYKRVLQYIVVLKDCNEKYKQYSLDYEQALLHVADAIKTGDTNWDKLDLPYKQAVDDSNQEKYE